MLQALAGFIVGVAITAVLCGAIPVRGRGGTARPGEDAGTQSAPADDTERHDDRDVLWSEVLSGLRIGIAIVDATGRTLWENEALSANTGSRHGRVLVDAACDRLRLAAASNGRAQESLDFSGPPVRSLEVSCVAVSGGAFACFVEDVTERRRLEQVRTDLVANVSHELKTPVGALSVLAETLEGEAGSDVERRLASRMVDESQRMARTIEDLLELSRVEMGAEMLSVPVDLGSVARDAIERVRAIAEKDGITLGVDAESDCTVIGDPHQLRSAVRNLVDNAVQYSHPEGHVDVRVRRAGDGIVLEVEDRGIGIPAANIDRIFERFYRIDRARSRVTGGTGIGLSIVRHVAHNHGAAVDVRSYEGEGSIFTMVFPATGTTPATGGTQ